ncbi:MAG: SWIB/MDM2 domain-containing protein [Gemmatimonadales bacterium]|jgi:chromatin remodeling complex protein RSC6|nr:SWIB/MDM2 domain-containing protein [Gemmatimonadales bacterium]
MATKKKAVKKAKAKKTVKKAVKKAKAKKAVKKAVKKAKVKKAVKRAARKPNAAFMKAMTPSAALAVVVGEGGLPRTEVTKKLWAYIKKKNLQDKVNRRMIHADDALRAIFKKDAVNMFEMTKLVNKHLS